MQIRATILEGRARALRAAYSMIELLVAIAILGIMFVSLYSGFSAGFAIIQLARENLRATQVLQEKMETIRLYTWEQINTPGFIPTNFLDSFYAAASNTSSQGITYTVEKGEYLSTILDAYNAEFKKRGKGRVTLEDVKRANPTININRIYVGQEILIPDPWAVN